MLVQLSSEGLPGTAVKARKRPLMMAAGTVSLLKKN